MNRRSFITGLVSALAAPVIVRSTSLMQVRGIVMPPAEITVTELANAIYRVIPSDTPLRLIGSGVEPLLGWEHWRNWPADPLNAISRRRLH